MVRWHSVHRRALDRGAAAVEFALVLPVFLLLVVGILDYGRFWYDSAGLRQGAREAARQAVIQQYPGTLRVAPGTACDAQVGVGAKIACSAKTASDNTIGTPVVKILPVTGGWAQGKQLVVCMQSQETGTGFVPLPANGILTTKVYMSIEVGAVVDPSYADTAPTGGNWSWC